MAWRFGLITVLLGSMALAGVGAAQRTVRATAGWLKMPADGAKETVAFVTVENGTMYDVYIVGVETEVAGAVELRQTPKGAAGPVATKEVTVPAFDRLDMSPEAAHIHLGGLTRPLKAGETVTLTLQMDTGPPLVVDAVVK